MNAVIPVKDNVDRPSKRLRTSNAVDLVENPAGATKFEFIHVAELDMTKGADSSELQQQAERPEFPAVSQQPLDACEHYSRSYSRGWVFDVMAEGKMVASEGNN